MNKPPDELLEIFRVEAAEYLEALNSIVLQLEVASPDEDHKGELREVNRVAHSLKGAARAVGQTTIETLAHHMEDVFGLALSGKLTLSPEVCDALYDSLDVIQFAVDDTDTAPETVARILRQLDLLAGKPEAAAPVTPPPAATRQAAAPRSSEDTVRVSLTKLDQLMGQASELLIARMHSEQRRQDVRALLHEQRRWQRLWRQARSAYIRTTRHLRDTRDLSTSGESGADLLSLLEFLDATQHYMTQTGRAVLDLNRDLAQDHLHLASLVDTLQADLASVRMLPFETILGGFQRMIRDLARDSGKDMTLVVEGDEVELDKHVLEMLKDPLMHLLRNAADHGIESPGVREAAGKPASGTIRLTITSRGNDIEVTIADDGRGIDPAVVRRRAVDAGLLRAGEGEELSAEEASALIFEPGFSTAATVTAVSGRGVGLDVVRQRIEALRGRLWMENMPGKGVVFHLIVPVSLTRMRCLLARIGPEQYALPLTTVRRIINVDASAVFNIEGRPMIEVEGRPIPLVTLHEVLERPGTPPPLTGSTPVLILHATERSVAFIIEELVSEQELVLKSLGAEMGRVPNVSGAAILGTGDVVVVLNSSDLIRAARRVRTVIKDRAAAPPAPAKIPDREHWILVVDDSLTTRTLERNILEAAGFRVRTATDGTEALQSLMEHPADVIVADVEMPNMNGFELTRRVKGDPRWQHIPLILVTSLDSPSDRERGLRAGADAYLVKSRFDQDELLHMIEQMV